MTHTNLNTWVESAYPVLFSVAITRTRDRAEAEDMVQDCLVTLLRTVPRAKLLGLPAVYLRTVAFHACMYLRRSRAGRMGPHAPHIYAALWRRRQRVLRPDELAGAADLEALAERVLADWPGELAAWKLSRRGYGSREIAHLLRVSQGAVITRLCRAKRRLRRALSREDA